MAFLETVTVSVDLTILIWLIPVVFFIHDGEEVLMVRRWLRRHQSQPSIVKATRFLASDKYVTGQFAIAIFLLGVSLLIVTYTAAVQYHSQGRLSGLYAGILVALVIDGLKHIGMWIRLKHYTPGVITAIVVEIPVASYAIYRFYSSGVANFQTFIWGFIIALPFVWFVVVGGLIVGKVMAPRIGFRKPSQ
ncbi:HXXEE domain-containing protein [Paenibacillus sp. MBLB2552]|uniref:HXXEE domain-containing protein n=1 Tax=Paenibacillus mellifer TaxID=2937794 RepID=A0A9X1Y5K0_9BACL|nr:HXXEE domain-containing protein [Paenibacillus mellifer]MCK8490061.1 HXXEE domain-containing protein [Paenibacillus mellifer]